MTEDNYRAQLTVALSALNKLGGEVSAIESVQIANVSDIVVRRIQELEAEGEE